LYIYASFEQSRAYSKEIKQAIVLPCLNYARQLGHFFCNLLNFLYEQFTIKSNFGGRITSDEP
jgi:hypothetical protein